ncbi:MAG: glutaredoxin family protein [Pseudomonadota bacterium]
MKALVVYSRRGCHMCDDLLEELEPLVRGKLALSVVDIDEDQILRERYNDKVPVVAFRDQEICRYKLDRQAMQALLAEAAGP